MSRTEWGKVGYVMHVGKMNNSIHEVLGRLLRTLSEGMGQKDWRVYLSKEFYMQDEPLLYVQ